MYLFELTQVRSDLKWHRVLFSQILFQNDEIVQTPLLHHLLVRLAESVFVWVFGIVELSSVLQLS